MLSLSVNIRNENTDLIPLSIIQNLPPDSSKFYFLYYFWWRTCDLILWMCNMCPFIYKLQVTNQRHDFHCASGCTHVKAIFGFCFIWGLIVSFLVKYWTHYRNREFSLWISAWKQSGLALPWLSDMLCMIQCLSLEMFHSRRLDGVDVSPKAEFLVWRHKHRLCYTNTKMHIHTHSVMIY